LAEPIFIDDPDDPRIGGYRQVRERDLIGREGLFVAEGEVVLRMLIASRRFEAVSVLLADKRVARLAPMLGGLPTGVPVYAAGQAVLDAIAGFHLHRGILALGRRTEASDAGALLADLPARSLVVVLVGVANHDNMGGVFRNAAAFGADAVILDATCCDPFYRKAIRVSVGGVLSVPFARLAAGVDVVGLLERHGFEAVALSPRGATPLSAFRRPDRAAVILGAEGPGLPPELLDRCASVRIPMAPGFDSLNLATTSGVVLHHLNEPPPPCGEGVSGT
jgi:tRNA G18 (ribose-2'-O)-methylase SpoU